MHIFDYQTTPAKLLTPEITALLVSSRMSKADRIRAVVGATLGKVTKRDILAKCPDISTAMVELTLKAMLDEGIIRKIGNGRAAAYVRND